MKKTKQLLPILMLLLSIVGCVDNSTENDRNPVEGKDYKEDINDYTFSKKDEGTLEVVPIPDTLILYIDTPNIIRFLDKKIFISKYSEGPTITDALIDYWTRCYEQSKSLPNWLEIKYQTEDMKRFKEGLKTAINDAQLRLMVDIGMYEPDGKEKRYPILYQENLY